MTSLRWYVWIQRLLLVVWLLGWALLPLVWCPRCEVRFEVPKVDLVRNWIVILYGLYILCSVIWRRPFNRVQWGLLVSLGLYLIWMVLVSIAGVDYEQSLLGNYFRMDGITTLLHLLGMAVFVGLWWQPSYRNLTAMALVLSGSTLGMWGLMQVMTAWSEIGMGGVMTDDWLMKTSFGNTNFLAGYLTLLLPLGLYLIHFSTGRRRWLWLSCCLLMTVTLGLLHSWGGWLGLFLAIGLWWGWELGRKWQILLALGLTTVVFLGLCFYWIGPSNGSPESRRSLYARLSVSVTDSYLVGWGWANVDEAYWHSSPDKSHDLYLDKAHGHIVESLVTGGVLGLILYLNLLGMTAWYLWNNQTIATSRSWRKAVMICLFLYIIHSQTNIISISEEMLFWWMLGMALVDESV